jgi:hypothetical protein
MEAFLIFVTKWTKIIVHVGKGSLKFEEKLPRFADIAIPMQNQIHSFIPQW